MARREYKLSKESAAAAVDELFDYYDIVDDDLPDDQRGLMAAVRAKLLRHYREGALENVRSDKGLAVRQHLREAPGDVKVIDYGRMTGEAKITMDAFKPTQFYARMHALMGALSGLGADAMRALSTRDQSAMETLAQVFLAG